MYTKEDTMIRGRPIKRGINIACRYFKRSLSNVQTPVVIIASSERRTRIIRRITKGHALRTGLFLVVLFCIIGLFNIEGQTSWTSIVSVPKYDGAAYVIDNRNREQARVDLETWRNMSLEHWKIYNKPQDLLKIMKPVYDKRFKNPCWYEKSRRGKILKCLPYFFLTGVKKCGTSTLFGAIRRHPDIVTNTRKETQWFPRRRFENVGNSTFRIFVNLFDKSAKIIEKELMKTPSKLNPKIIGEGTPANLHLNSHWRYLPENAGLSEPKYVILDYIHHLIPQTKVIIIFRNPIERLYSDYYHEHKWLLKGENISVEHFHDTASRGITLYKDCFKHFTVRSCVYNETIYYNTKFCLILSSDISLEMSFQDNSNDMSHARIGQEWNKIFQTVELRYLLRSLIIRCPGMIIKIVMHIQLGIFHVFWEDLLRVFPREQILIVHKDDMESDLKRTIMRIYEYLEMRPLNNQELVQLEKETEKFAYKRYNRTREPMLQETKEMLEDFYQPFNEKMFELTNDKRFLYKTSDSI